MKSFLAVLGCFLISSLAFAGKESSGGGDAAISPTGHATLADVYSIDKNENESLDQNRMPLGRKVSAELNQILNMSQLYLDQSNLSEVINSKDRLYIGVDQIPARKACDEHLNYSDLPQGSTIEQWACTDGNRTFIVKNLYDSFSTRDKALGLIHEGLRAMHAKNFMIADIVNGLRVAMKAYDVQKSGDFSKPLDPSEKNALARLIKANLLLSKGYEGTEAEYRAQIAQITLNDYGAIVHKDLITGGAKLPSKLGIGSRFLYKVNAKGLDLDNSAVLVATNLCEGVSDCHVGAAAHINYFVTSILAPNSELNYLKIGDRTQISYLIISPPTPYAEYPTFFTIGKDAQLSGVSIVGVRQTEIGDRVTLNAVILKGNFGDSGTGSLVFTPGTSVSGLYVANIFNTSTLKFDGQIEAPQFKPCYFAPIWPLTFSTVNDLKDLSNRCNW
jgi:hypothetical protein